MTQFEALMGLYFGTHALVLGGGAIVYLADRVGKLFVVEQHGRVVDKGRLTPLQAKRFTEAATGAREVTRAEVDLSRVVRRATA